MNKKTEAKCSGSMLTVGFHSAHPPLIWRFDLERNHSFTLSLQGDEGDWELGITTPKGDFYPVVHFATRDDAEEALLRVEKTLARKRGGSFIGKAMIGLGIVAAIIVIGVFVFGSIVNSTMGNAVTAINSGAIPGVAMPQMGVPQSADDVLQAPR
jgi:hypothetical protein